MKILAVQTGLSPHSVLGGTITDRKFLTRLADRNIKIHVLAQEGEPIVSHENFAAHHWRRRVKRSIPYINNLSVALDVRKILREIGPVDWVRFNQPYGVGIGTVLGARQQRLWASYLHLEPDRLQEWVDSWLPTQCDLITSLSYATRGDLVARCPKSDDERNIVVPLGIDTDRFRPDAGNRAAIRQSLGIAESAVVVLYVGQLIPRKGITELIETWRRLGDRSNVHLVMIGKAKSPQSDLQKAVEALAATDKRVHYLNKVDYQENHKYFQAADFFFFPTRLEGYGIVVGEAMACQLPVVTTHAQGVSEVVDASCALQAKVGDVEEMVSCVSKLIEDANLRRTMGSAARDLIGKRFTWDTIIERLVQVLSAPLAGGAHRP
jgi:glycosyltransferase involved in cell wall biosynthesis